MVEIFGTIERSEVEGDKQITVFRIPAVSKTLAKRRAKVNARVKGYNGPSVGTTSKIGEGDLPGVSFYDVRVNSQR